MSDKAPSAFDLARKAGETAPLQAKEKKTNRPMGRPARPPEERTRRKNMNLPAAYFDRFEALKASGALPLHVTLAAFVTEAFNEHLTKLEAQSK